MDTKASFRIVWKIREGKEKQRFLTVVQRAVTGLRKIDDVFWDELALANYAQGAA